MKRHGRQHGMVRTYPILSAPWNPRPKPSNLNELSSPPTAGLFSTKVYPKPTNHSKFTGKCGRPQCHHCHLRPTCKSKDKVKGSQKMRSSSSDYRLIAWRGVDPVPAKRFSATGLLDYLARDDYMYSRCEANYNNDDESYEHEIEVDEEEEKEEEMSLSEVGLFWQLVDGNESWCLVEEI